MEPIIGHIYQLDHSIDIIIVSSHCRGKS